jgi:hypothetical protein
MDHNEIHTADFSVDHRTPNEMESKDYPLLEYDPI